MNYFMHLMTPEKQNVTTDCLKDFKLGFKFFEALNMMW